jgi:hypothetical protein
MKFVAKSRKYSLAEGGVLLFKPNIATFCDDANGGF